MCISDSTPNLHLERCNDCGRCVQVCTRGVLILDQSHLSVDPGRDCDGCGTCEEVCPQDALDCPFEIVWADDKDQESTIGGESSA